ncbi:hypothetical protein B0H14DRAFT_2859694, partial [Mycena olivaceomarginata]
SRSCDENEGHARCSTFHRPTERGKEGILRTAFMSLSVMNARSTIVPQALCRVGCRPACPILPTALTYRATPTRDGGCRAPPSPSMAMNACSPFARHTSSPALQQLTRPMMPLRHPWYLCPRVHGTSIPRARPTSLPASPRRTGLALVPAPHSTYIAGGIRMYALVRTRR